MLPSITIEDIRRHAIEMARAADEKDGEEAFDYKLETSEGYDKVLVQYKNHLGDFVWMDSGITTDDAHQELLDIREIQMAEDLMNENEI